MKASDFSELMTVDVFEGGTGNLVLCQEWPSMRQGERYTRIMIPMDEARALAESILAVAREASK